MSALNSVFSPDNIGFMVQGLLMTIGLSVGVVFLSLFFGAVLGILRNYVKILGPIAGIYIEIFRNTPLLLWMAIRNKRQQNLSWNGR